MSDTSVNLTFFEARTPSAELEGDLRPSFQCHWTQAGFTLLSKRDSETFDQATWSHAERLRKSRRLIVVGFQRRLRSHRSALSKVCVPSGGLVNITASVVGAARSRSNICSNGSQTAHVRGGPDVSRLSLVARRAQI
ncbi:hypothetical protein AAFF_G00183060 [Aldrovandia affinis]|uniref:Uncharacterized protein n=1 Tax=Aldrovandia affinis TaxID=143900 RepID=A0AAD7W662_9TELE|nr:hypothetical protein AAFF_G00183060 [Aldrovandia affinis]